MLTDNAIAKLTDTFEALLLEHVSRVELVGRAQIDLADLVSWFRVGHCRC